MCLIYFNLFKDNFWWRDLGVYSVHHVINISSCTFCIVKVFIGFDTLFLADFGDFQNDTAGLCINNSIDKDVK